MGPPVPREHGAWVMLYAPALVPLLGFQAASLPSLLLLLCITSVFFTQNALGLLLRGRREAATTAWCTVYGVVGLAAGGTLLVGYGHWDLVWVGLPGALTAARQLSVGMSARKRVDRSVVGEVLGVGGLALTALAAYVVGAGGLDVVAVGLWLAFWSKFVSGVFHVKMLVGAMKARGERNRWALGRGAVTYHAVLAAAVFTLLLWFHDRSAILASVAYLPLLFRAFVGWLRLPGGAPRLRTVGLFEAGFTTWFVAFMTAALVTLN